MNNKEFITALSNNINLSPAETQKFVDALCTAFVNIVNEGDTLTLKGFGTFELKKRLERLAINPSTLQRILLPPKLLLAFKPAGTLKETINETT